MPNPATADPRYWADTAGMQFHIHRKKSGISGIVLQGLPESRWAKDYIETAAYTAFENPQLYSNNQLTQIFKVPVGADGSRVIVKTFGIGRHRKKFRNIEFHASMQLRNYARRSCRIACRILAAGVTTPQPIAWWVVRRNGHCIAQYYMYRCIEPALTFSEYVNRDKDPALHRVLIDEYAGFVAQIHKAEFRHGDLAGGNILVTYPGVRHYYLIDLEKSRPNWWPLRMLRILFEYRDFKRINLPIFKQTIADPHGLFIECYKAHRNSPLPDAWYRYWLRQK